MPLSSGARRPQRVMARTIAFGASALFAAGLLTWSPPSATGWNQGAAEGDPVAAAQRRADEQRHGAAPAARHAARARPLAQLGHARQVTTSATPSRAAAAWSTPTTTRTALPWAWAGENIGWNSGLDDASSPVRVHEKFMASPGHRANVLTAAFTHGGVGAAAADGQMFQGYVQNTRMYTELFLQPPGRRATAGAARRHHSRRSGGGGGGGGGGCQPAPAAGRRRARRRRSRRRSRDVGRRTSPRRRPRPGSTASPASSSNAAGRNVGRIGWTSRRRPRASMVVARATAADAGSATRPAADAGRAPADGRERRALRRHRRPRCSASSSADRPGQPTRSRSARRRLRARPSPRPGRLREHAGDPRGARPRQALSAWRRGGRGAARRVPGRRAGRVRRDHGQRPDPASRRCCTCSAASTCPRRARSSSTASASRRSTRSAATLTRRDEDRLRLPVLQPHPAAERGGERGAAVPDRRRLGDADIASRVDELLAMVGLADKARPSSGPALRRRAAARGARPGAGHQPGHPPGR